MVGQISLGNLPRYSVCVGNTGSGPARTQTSTQYCCCGMTSKELLGIIRIMSELKLFCEAECSKIPPECSSLMHSYRKNVFIIVIATKGESSRLLSLSISTLCLYLWLRWGSDQSIKPGSYWGGRGTIILLSGSCPTIFQRGSSSLFNSKGFTYFFSPLCSGQLNPQHLTGAILASFVKCLMPQWPLMIALMYN